MEANPVRSTACCVFLCSVLGSVSPEPQLQFGRPASAELKISAGNPACTSASSAAAAQDVPGVAAANSCSDGQSSSRLRRSASPLDSDFLDFNLDQEIASLPAEVAALMRERGLVEQLGSKRRRWQEMKVGAPLQRVALETSCHKWLHVLCGRFTLCSFV